MLPASRASLARAQVAKRRLIGRHAGNPSIRQQFEGLRDRPGEQHVGVKRYEIIRDNIGAKAVVDGAPPRMAAEQVAWKPAPNNRLAACPWHPVQKIFRFLISANRNDKPDTQTSNSINLPGP